MFKVFSVLLLSIFIIPTALAACFYGGDEKSLTMTAVTESSLSSGNMEERADLNDIQFNSSGLYIAIGSNGKVLTSDDGLTWLDNQVDTDMGLVAVACGNGGFAAAGGNGMIITSEDGVNWVQRESGTDASLYGIIWDGQRYIAVGPKTLLTSLDGKDWLYREMPDIDPNNGTNKKISLFYGKVFWDGKQYFTGGSGNYILASEDLEKWTVLSGDSLGSGMYYGFARNSSRYAAVGDHFEIMTSEDGHSWTEEGLNIQCCDNIEDDHYTLCINSVVWGKDKFVAVGQRGLILISDNGIEWRAIPSVTRVRLNAVIWDGKRYIAVGDNKTIITSVNGIDWS